jgi:uncharacterized membrane protein
MPHSPERQDGSRTRDISQLPFVAPCRELAPDAPIRWIRHGFDDVKRAPRQSLSYGVLTLLLCYLVAYAGYQVGGLLVLLAILSGLTLLGPVVAIGLYSISCQLQNGLTPRLGYCLRDSSHGLGNLALFSSVLIVLFLLWVHVGHLLHLFFPVGGFRTSTLDLVFFFGIGSAVGAVFAVVTFCISAFSLPMVMDRKTDLVTAIVTSINAVLRNRPAMLRWAAIILAWTLASIATGLLGLALAFPVLGHATWHAYRETIDASDWPEYG